MKVIEININELIEIPEFRNFYTPQPIDELVQSYQIDGQKVPIHITNKNEIINGYRMIDAIRVSGDTQVKAIILEDEPTLHVRILLNQYRVKTTMDKIVEMKEIFIRFPKRQGQRNPDGERYNRDEVISNSLNNRWSGDLTLNKLEYILKNDLEGNILSKGIIEKNWKVDTCYDFLVNKMPVDLERNYGFTGQLIDGTFTVAEVNKFINQRQQLDERFEPTFVIPEKANFYNMDCVELAQMDEFKKMIDLILTSIPYWDLRKYQLGDIRQLGQEETKEEFALNIAKIFGKLCATLKDTANVFINIGETYKDGLAQGIPFIIKEYIEKHTTLIYKENIIWSKKNPHPQGEDVKRPVNAIEYLLWFVVDPKKSKYKLLTFPVEGKVSKVTNGAKDVSNNGTVSKKNKSISKTYGKISNHLSEQVVENIIVTSIGKNHEIFKISELGHPASMSPMLPVTMILMSTDEGDLVCDPFGGSNVVGKMSLELNRRYVGAELSKEYYDIGCQMLIEGEKNFDRDGLDTVNQIVYTESYQSNEQSTSCAA